MAFEVMLSVQSLSSSPNTQVTTETTSASKAQNMIGIEKNVSSSETLSDKKEATWLKLNSSTVFEPVGVVPPAATQSVADGSDMSTRNQTFLPQLEILPKPVADQTSQISLTIENQDVSQDAAPDGSSEKTSLTEIFTNAVTTSTQLGTIDARHAETKPDIPLRMIAPSEVARHNTVQDSWLIIRGEVFDVTKFQHEHPGGAKSEPHMFFPLLSLEVV
jgi:hypothetical protein